MEFVWLLVIGHWNFYIMFKVKGYKIKKLAPAEFELVKDKGVPVRIFATFKLLEKMDSAVFEQATNVSLLPGLVGPVLVMPDAHSGYGAPIGTVFATSEDGYVSPGAIGFDINCGMRLLITNLSEEEIRPYLEKLVNKLFEMVPPGVGKKGFLRISKNQLKELVERGVPYLVKTLGVGWEEDLKAIEEGGKIEGADFSVVSQRAVERGFAQLATLGSGNHYLEIQRVEKIFDTEFAKKYGIEREGQIGIMIHCGSRGFGHQVCSDYLRIFERKIDSYKIKVADRQLVCLPLSSRQAQDYIKAMSSAANFAFVNREAITHQVRRAFEKVLGGSAKNYDLRLIYDVAHNIGKFEEHIIPGVKRKARVFVHRKGATRSFPGQPVIIGGSMETGSYFLIGKETSLLKSFGSTAHGSGRTMSRAKAKRQVRGEKLWREMLQRGIYVKSASFSGLAEEAGVAYKNISDVVEAVDKAGLSSPVVYFKPIGNIKG